MTLAWSATSSGICAGANRTLPFDAALADRHAKRPQTPSERAAAVTAVDWDQVISFVRGGPWSRYAGPEPGMGGCRPPREMLAKYGIDAVTWQKYARRGDLNRARQSE
jgi:hypothetical protein